MAQNIMGWIMAALAVVAAFLAPSMAPWALLLILAIGLVSGFMAPLEDVATRVAYYVLAAVLPMIADNLDLIPTVGGQLNSILDNFAVGIGGIALANFLVAVWGNLTPSSED